MALVISSRNDGRRLIASHCRMCTKIVLCKNQLVLGAGIDLRQGISCGYNVCIDGSYSKIHGASIGFVLKPVLPSAVLFDSGSDCHSEWKRKKMGRWSAWQVSWKKGRKCWNRLLRESFCYLLVHYGSFFISLCQNLQETSPGLIARLSKNLRKFSLSEWQFIGPTTKQRNVFVRPAETAGFSPWHRDIQQHVPNIIC